MISFCIYVVDDEEFIRDAVELNLGRYDVFGFASAEAAMAPGQAPPPDLVLLDVGLPGLSGVEALAPMRRLWPRALFIMITAYEDVDTVVTAMKGGAYDYVVKPLHMDSLKNNIENALETLRLRKEVSLLHQRYLEENLPLFIGRSRAIQAVMDFVGKVAASPDAPVLICGPTGTGKELIAGAIHYKSPNFRGRLVTVNCAAIPAELIESELFGYEPGAFSGARTGGKRGLIEEADGGTLFLDEVGDLSLEAQAKLLRFLDGGEFIKVGSARPTKVRARVVSATNRDLAAMIDQGQFRRDLYYRLAVTRVDVPSLMERPEDIEPIARHFLVAMADKYGKRFLSISPEAMAYLRGRPWEGNVRELKAVLERAVIAGDGPELTMEGLRADAPAAPAAAGQALPPLTPAGLDLPALLEGLERDYLQQAEALGGGSDVRAAELLGLNYHTFRYRKKKLLGD